LRLGREVSVTRWLLVLPLLILDFPLSATGGTIADKAFPSAEGFGSDTPGGRGGTVCQVTNLSDSGTGSLRACLTATGPRTVVFRTGGTIEVQSPIVVTNPYLTIAGQTAPGGGITLKASPSFKQGPLEIRTQDVIIRFLRFRAGPSTALSEGRRSLLITEGSHNVIIDHCSISWGTDDNLSILDGAHDITVQWSIISEALSDSTHVEGPHSRGLAISGKNYNSTDKTRDISVHHNLFAHNAQRNPLNASYGLVDVVNNVIYNYKEKATSSYDLQATVPNNIVSNYYKVGVDSSSIYEMNAHDAGTGFGSRIYVNGNIGPHRPDDTLPQENVVAPSDRIYIVPERFAAPAITTTDALQAFTDVLGGAGVRVPHLDSVDQRVISETENGTGSIIDDPSQVGGWPVLAPGAAYDDQDGDGMSNLYEKSHGLSPNDPSDGSKIAENGYTNLENFLNKLASLTDHAPNSYCTPSGDICYSTRKVKGVRKLRIRTIEKYFSEYRVCVRAPDDSRACRMGRMRDRNNDGIWTGSMNWRKRFPYKGPGAYTVRWRSAPYQSPKLRFLVKKKA
jgi:pectate lyase